MVATYSVCLFILLMQFLFMYINDMVGKGVGMNVLAELFFYASVTFTPVALPLSILLASLMTFGNLGEHLELLAMKASGISLLRIMKPLIYCVVVLSGISFVFQNNIVPQAQTKMYTIVLSLKQKSPELDIPEGVFYKEIQGYNVYVKHKNKKTGLLRDMMIYDYSKGFENAVVVAADSGRITVASDKKSLVLTLYNGESFENLNTNKNRKMNEKIPYIRETFTLRKILIDFSTNFEMMDESIMGSRDMNKTLGELSVFIDSVRHEQDSIRASTVRLFRNSVYANAFQPTETTFRHHASLPSTHKQDSLFAKGFVPYYNQLRLSQQINLLQQAKSEVERVQSDYMFTMGQRLDEQKKILSHISIYYKRFAMAFSCLLFFFIGAPLGAIVRKGGFGLPAVLSVVLYLLYYCVDNFGVKMVKQDMWAIWQGVWLSSFLLTGLGIFFTYQALNDSTMLNPDDWKIVIQKWIKKLK
jgi:lipopolysaccharide export system permease protein